MLTEVTGRPASLICRLPNRLILMSTVCLVHDAPWRARRERSQTRCMRLLKTPTQSARQCLYQLTGVRNPSEL